MLFHYIVLFSSLFVVVYLQGEPCDTPSGQPGVCQLFQKCTSLLQLYAKDKSRNTISLLQASQRNCGNRLIGRDPILCCRDQASDCTDPLGTPGICKSIRDCPPILSEFSARQSDPAFTSYIQKSNAGCNYVKPNVCCTASTPNIPAGTPTQPPTRPTAPPTPPPTPATEAPPRPTTYDGLSARLLTPDEGCGFSNVTHNKVVGGVDAVKGGWPWMVLLGYRDSLGEVTFKCGASLITNRHVLTAAHCLRTNLVAARLGEHDTSTDQEARTIDVEVVKTVQHPNYDKKDGNSDLAVLYLGQSVPFTDTIRPICLPLREPQRSKNYERYTPFVAGWGHTQEGGKSATVLQELQITVFPNAECVDRYKAINKLISQKQFDDAVLCAGVLAGGKDSCQGDSGGPLMQPSVINGSPYFHQIGVVSYGIGCARTNVPGVYTRVQKFVDWIQEKVNEPI